MADLRAAFDDYWEHVTPGDRARAEFVIGHPADPETFLQSGDWHLASVPWSHVMIARGAKEAGDWRIRAARTGTYRFEVRRWPVEVTAPIRGVPVIENTVDAWDARGPKTTMIYAGEKPPFTALPVAFVRLKVGAFHETRPVGEDDVVVSFDVRLDKTNCDLKAEFLDAQRRVIAGGYYVYCRRK